MKVTFYCMIAVLLLIFSCSEKENHLNREVSFNDRWKFFRAEVQNGQAVNLDDSGWKILNLPHDFSIEDILDKTGVKQIGPFSEKSAGGASTGHTVGGKAWYRKHFTLNKEDEGKIIQVLFDAVYMNADFWLNGKLLGNHPYGYTAFAYDLTHFLNPAGQDNVLAVQVKNEGKNSRWYSGSGIYRNASLIKTNPVHIDLWGVYITTPEVSAEKATVAVGIKLVNENKEDKNLALKMKFLDPEGNEVTHFSDDKQLAATSEFSYAQTFEIADYSLWTLENPNLYSLVVQLWDGKKLLDETTQKFGIRTIDFSPEKGFLLNGENVLLKGGCMHHDNGPLGSAAFDRAEFRRVRIMKGNGFNAIRTAHNPPSKAFLDACDELGMLVLDEAFDQWQRPKNPQDYNLYFDDWWEKDIESMVLRDRNHPSVIIWSIGNEINERADSSGLAIAKKLKAKIKSMDDTRPVTQAVCNFWDHPGWDWDKTAPTFAQMDIHGYNYQWNQYEPDHKKHPERIIIGTESFPKEAFDNWQLVEKHPYVIGDFVWTGWDYLGESGIGSTHFDNEKVGFLPPWPWFNANCGDVSILGYKKPQMYYLDVVWRNSELEMLVHAPVPDGRKEVVSMWGWPEEWKSWNWEGNEGKPLHVSVYSRCNQVRLELNGKVIGTKDILEKKSSETQMDNPKQSIEISALTATFEVPYQSGELVAIGFTNGKEVVRQTLKTANKPFALRIIAENDSIAASINDLAYFNVEVVDENGLLVPNAEIPVEFKLQGIGQLQAVANGNPTDMKSFQQPQVNTFRGKCQLIVRSSNSKGIIAVKAVSEKLEPATAEVQVVQM